MRSRKKALATFLATAMLLSITMTAPVTAAEKTFPDVVGSDWYYEAVTAMVKEGVIQGYPDGTFKPNDTVTYGEFLSMAMKQAAGGEIESTRAEEEHWAIDFYRYGLENSYYAKNDIKEGALVRTIPREHMALIISGILGDEIVLGTEMYARLDYAITDVKDTIDEYAFEIIRSYGAGILTGYPNGKFKPRGTLTRAEAATVIWRLSDESQRQIPVLSELPDAEVVEAPDTRTLEERVADIIQNGAKPVEFDPATDTTLYDGRTVMNERVAREYADIALSSLKFYGEKGKYYVTVTLPELPSGYMWAYDIDISKSEAAGGGFIWNRTSNTVLDSIRLPATGTVTRQIETIKSLSSVGHMRVGLFPARIVEWYKDKGVYNLAMCYGYVIGYDVSDSSYRHIWMEADPSSIELTNEYNLSRHYTWK